MPVLAQRPLAPLARHRWQSTLHRCKCTSGRRRLRAPLHHSPTHAPIHAPGRQGRGGGGAQQRWEAVLREGWTPCPMRLAAGWSPGSSTWAQLWTALHAAPLLFWGLPTPFPISQGTIPAPGLKAGLPGAPGSRSVLPRCPLLRAGLGSHRGRTEAQGPSPCTPPPLHQECAVHALPVPTPDLSPAGPAGAESLSSHTHTQL